VYLCVCVCEANPERDALRPEGPSQENEERGMDWRQERGKGERERARARERKRERERIEIVECVHTCDRVCERESIEQQSQHLNPDKVNT
jgi:hypothetical protein